MAKRGPRNRRGPHPGRGERLRDRNLARERGRDHNAGGWEGPRATATVDVNPEPNLPVHLLTAERYTAEDKRKLVNFFILVLRYAAYGAQLTGNGWMCLATLAELAQISIATCLNILWAEKATM